MEAKGKLNATVMVRMAILIAVIIIMAFTPLGYLKTSVIEITFIQIPVVVGAILMGPSAGAILGGVFGLTSFLQCFGMSTFGAYLLSLNPISTFVLCLIPRILMGWLCGYIFLGLNKIDRTKLLSFAVTGASAAILNTILFVGFFLALFSRYMGRFYEMLQVEIGAPLWTFLVAFVGLNGVVEAIVCCVVGAAVSKTIYHFASNKKQS